MLAGLMSQVSRARIKSWIEAGAVSVNGEIAQSVRMKVGAGDEIDVVPLPAPEETAYTPEADVSFDVVYEDDSVIVVNKPAGLVVHPAAGHWSGVAAEWPVIPVSRASSYPESNCASARQGDIRADGCCAYRGGANRSGSSATGPQCRS